MCLLMMFFVLAAVPALGDETFESFFFPLPPGVTHGAGGSRWETEIFEHNTGPERVCLGTSAIPEPLCLPPGTRGGIMGSKPFWLAYFGATQQLSFSIHVRDTSRAGLSSGAEIPVVRQNEFRSDRIQLLNVRVAPKSRRSLRLYTLSESAIALRVRVWDFNGDLRRVPVLLGDRTYTPVAFGQTTFERYLVLADFDSDFPVGATDRVRIEIDNTSGDGRFWAFVSVTNDQTSHVTTVTPQ